MPRVCTVCSHPDRPAIDQSMLNHRPFRAIADTFRVSRQALVRHYDDHLPAALAKAKEAEDVRQAIDHITQFKVVNSVTLAILKEARDRSDHDTALRAIDRVLKQVELQAKLIGELDDRPQVNILISPEWAELRSVILRALAPYPEARLALAEALDARGG